MLELTSEPTPEPMPGAEFDTTPSPKPMPEPTTKPTPERVLTCAAQKISQNLLVRHDFGGVSSVVEPTPKPMLEPTPELTPELMPGAEFDTTPTPKPTPEPTTKPTPERVLTCTAKRNQPKTFSET